MKKRLASSETSRFSRKITLAEIADLKGVSYESVRRRRKKENWKAAGYSLQKFGRVETFHIKNLPADIENLFATDGSSPMSDGDKALSQGASDVTSFLRRGQMKLTPVPASVPVIDGAIASQIASGISDKGRSIALARMDLLREWQEYREGQGKKTAADEEFLAAYNSGALHKNILDALGDIASVKTFYRWAESLGNKQDWTNLVPGHFFKNNEGSQLSPEEQSILLRILLTPHKHRIGTAIRLAKTYLKKQGISSNKSDRTFRRFAGQFKAKHYDLWVFIREGQKALRDKVEPFITRDPSLLEVGQVLVADGHRLNFMVINPHTGKPVRAVLVAYQDWKSGDIAGYEIMVEENVQCIAAALRNSIIRLGKFPQIAYQDNGKAFKARFFTSTESFDEIGLYGVFGRLGIMPVFAMPYNARSKPIERFFREFSDTCERLMPSFVGSSIEDKPAWFLRNEKFHKALHNEYTPTIPETIEIVEAWLGWYREQPCPHVAGKTIGQVFEEGKGPGVDIEALDDLMMAVRVSKIGKIGIRFLNADFADDALYGLRESVVIKYSLSDLTQVKVYDTRGQYLCTAARRVPVHPMAWHLGDVKDVDTLKYELSRQRRLEKQTVQEAKKFLSQGKPIELDWQRAISISPKTVAKIEEAAITLPAGPERIPDEALAPAPSAGTLISHLPEECEADSAAPPQRPFFGENAVARFEWHLEHGFTKPEDLIFKEEFMESNTYKMLFTFFEDQDKEVMKDTHERKYAAL